MKTSSPLCRWGNNFIVSKLNHALLFAILLCSALPRHCVIILFSLCSQTFIDFSISTNNFSFCFRTNKSHQKRTEKPTTNPASVPIISSFGPLQGTLKLILLPRVDSFCCYMLHDLVHQITSGLHLQPLLKQEQASFRVTIATSLLLSPSLVLYYKKYWRLHSLSSLPDMVFIPKSQ